MGRESRKVWTKRVERWRDSGLSAKEFARELGVNANTLAGWGYRLRADGQSSARREPPGESGARKKANGDERRPVEFVELVRAPALEQRFEIVATSGWTVRVPAQFDAEALQRLLAVMERT